MLAYRLTHPSWPRVQLRLLAYRPKSSALPSDTLKVVLQSCHNGEPIAESPIAEEPMTLMQLCQMLHKDLCDGWERQPEARLEA